jgi:hypothetical protein
MTVKLKNNVFGFSANAIGGSDTGIVLTSASLFPALGSGEYFYATIVGTNNAYEVVKCTAVVGNTLTVARAQEGTAAQSFASGSRIEMRITAQSILDAIGDATGAVSAASVSIADAGNYYSSTNVEGALQEAALASTTRWVPPWAGARTDLRVDDGLEQSVVNALAFIGVDPTGATDSTVGLQAALNSGAKIVRVPAGVYKIETATLTIPDNVSLVGDGVGATVFDGSGASYAALTSGRHIATVGGSWTQISNLVADVSKGGRTLTFATAPSLAPGDIVQIYNPTDFSFSAFRAVYRAGEFVRVAKVSGTTVTLQGTLCDNYTAASVNVYKLESATSCHLRGFTLKGRAGTGGAVFGVNLIHAVDSSIEDVRVTGCSYTGISVKECFNVQLRNCTGEEDFTANYGGDYGLAIANSHMVSVVGGYYCAARHGVTTGGFSGVGAVSCRYMYFQGVTISCTGDAQAADFHGNMEYAWFDNCVLDGGFAGGGDYFYITNNNIRGNPPGNGNILIYIAEMRGANVKVSNNICTSTALGSSGFGTFIHATLSAETPKGGVIDISNNTFNWEVATSNANIQSVLVQSDYTGSQPVDVGVKDNIVASVLGANFGVCQVNVIPTGASPYRTVEISGNRMLGAGSIYVRGVIAGAVVARKVIVNDNTIENVGPVPLFVEDVSEYIECRGNHIADSDPFPIYLSGLSSAAPCYHIDASDNTAINNLNVRTGSSLSNNGFQVVNAAYATIKNNVTGSFNQYLGVTSNAGFVVGEVVTGSTSGATATVTGFRSTTEIMISRTLVGSFTVAETITGGTSGATTTVTSAEAFCQTSRLRLADIGNLCVFNNNDLRLNTDSIGTISGYLSGCVLTAAANYNPPSLNDGDGATTTMTVTGAALTDQVSVAFSLDLQGITMTSWVSAANTVSVRFQNETGGVLDLGSGTLYARVVKR